MTKLTRVLAIGFCVIAMSAVSWGQKTWVGATGGGDGSSWSDALNWSGGVAPISTDQVVLDNSTVSGSYTVNLPSGAVNTFLVKLTITPGLSNTITLVLPAGSTSTQGLFVGDNTSSTDDIVLNNGAVLLNQSGAASGTPITVNGTANGTVRINNGGKYVHNTLRSSTTGLTSQLSNVAGTENGTVEFDVPGTGSYSPSASGRTYGNLVLTRTSGSGDYTVSGGNAYVLNGNLTINPNTTLVSTMTNSLTIKGNLTNNGTGLTIPSTQAVFFSGTSSQKIAGSASTTFSGNVTLSNSTGLTLSRNVIVNGTLTLTSGNISTSNTNLLTLGAAATVSGGSSSSYVNGPMSHTWTTSTATKTYPLGKNSTNRPLEITQTTPASPVIRAEVFNSNAGGSVGSLNAISTIRYYQTSLVSGTGASGGTAKIVFGSDDGVTGGQEANLVVAQSSTSNGTYASLGQSANSATSVTSSSYDPSSGDFLLLGSTSGNTLPVELTSLTVKVIQLTAEIHWSTATETNNYGFEVERRASGAATWQMVGFVAGAGTSTSPREYSYVDGDLAAGRYAYRIKQIDKDGTFKYVGTAELEIGLMPKQILLSHNYPNPFNPSTTIEFTVPENGHATLRVYTIAGQQVATLFDGEASAGKLYQAKFDASQLASGTYTSVLQSGSQRIVKKMMLTK